MLEPKLTVRISLGDNNLFSGSRACFDNTRLESEVKINRAVTYLEKRDF